jgi:hypothetical protein
LRWSIAKHEVLRRVVWTLDIQGNNMDILFAFIGAIIGSIVTVQYMYASDRLKLRGEVMQEVVAYCDDIYHLIQDMQGRKNAIYTRNLDGLDDEYVADSRQLSVLLKTSRPHTKLVIAYGEGDALGALNNLSSEFRQVVSILRNATRSAWASEEAEILTIFKDKIDPLRTRLQGCLLKGARTPSIWQILFRG